MTGQIMTGAMSTGKGGNDVDVDVQCTDVCNDVCIPIPNKVCGEVPYQTQVSRSARTTGLRYMDDYEQLAHALQPPGVYVCISKQQPLAHRAAQDFPFAVGPAKRPYSTA